MSARRGLIGRLVLMGLSMPAAERAVDAYAHELAEKQREELKRNPGIFEDALIDLIDSEREDGDD